MDKSKIEAELNEMRIPALQKRFAEVCGETTKSPNRKFLVKRILAEMESVAALQKAAPADAQPTTDAAAENEAAAAAPKSIARMKPVAGETPADEAAEEPTPEAAAKPRRGRKAKPAATTDGAEASDDGDEEKLSKLDLPALQERYRETIGRPTNSTNRRYLVWKLQQAAKGRVRIGPRAARGPGAAVDAKVLPVRLPTAVIGPLDEVWRRLGLRSRNEMFRRAMASYLVHVGESDLAGHFGATFSDDRSEANAE